MTGLVYQRPAARKDLIERYIYLAQEAGPEVADRFLVSAEASLDLLAAQPMLGAALGLQHPRLIEMRKWHVEGFDNILIFYIPKATVPEVPRRARRRQGL